MAGEGPVEWVNLEEEAPCLLLENDDLKRQLLACQMDIQGLRDRVAASPTFDRDVVIEALDQILARLRG